MSRPIAIVIGAVLVVCLVLFSMTFTVGFHEVAIKSRFGKATTASIITEPGLRFRLPLFVDKVTKVDRRLQLQESPLETLQLADGQQVVVRAFLLWQVETEGEGPLKFFSSYPSGVEDANNALTDRFRTALRSGLSRFTFHDLIGSQNRLAQAEEAVKTEMSMVRAEGIQPVTVGIGQLILSPNTAQAVLTRMQATRKKLSESERSRGRAEAEAISSRASGWAEKIRAFASRRAAEIRAAGDEQMAKYLGQMSEEESLAVFLTWLDALQEMLSERTTLVLPTDLAPMHVLGLNAPTDSKGIPMPTADGLEVTQRQSPPDEKPATKEGS